MDPKIVDLARLSLSKNMLYRSCWDHSPESQRDQEAPDTPVNSRAPRTVGRFLSNETNFLPEQISLLLLNSTASAAVIRVA